MLGATSVDTFTAVSKPLDIPTFFMAVNIASGNDHISIAGFPHDFRVSVKIDFTKIRITVHFE